MAKKKEDIEKYGTILAPDNDDEAEGNGVKPKRPVRPARPEAIAIKDDKAVKDLIMRLASDKLQDLQQLNDIPLKLIDPMAKGLAYYDATLETISEQCEELLDWYIKKCDSDIERYEAMKVYQDAAYDEPNPRKKTFWDKILGSPKLIRQPDLQPLDLNVKLAELRDRKADLAKMKDELAEEEHMTYFKKWAYHYLLNSRSKNHLLLDGHVALTDAQILNKPEGGMDDARRLFSR